MNNRVIQLALDLMLIQTKYSSQELRSLEKALAAGDYPTELREILQLVASLKALTSNSERPSSRRVASGKAIDGPITKTAVLAAIRKSSLSRLNKIADHLAITVNRKNRADTQRAVEGKILSLSPTELNELTSAFRSAPGEADQGYLGLAEFILNSQREDRSNSDKNASPEKKS